MRMEETKPTQFRILWEYRNQILNYLNLFKNAALNIAAE